MTIKTTAVMPILLVFAVAGCSSSSSSGGDSSPSEVPFTGFSNISANETTVFEGQAITSDYTVDPNTGEVTVTNNSAVSDSSARLVTENGERVALSVSAPGSSVSFDTRQDDSRTVSGGNVQYESANGDNIAVIADEATAGYEYQTFGAWVTGFNSGQGSVGTATYGARTAVSDIPGGTSATYSGKSIGVARLADGQPYSTTSNVNVNVTNFNSVNMNSSATMAENLNTGTSVSASELDFNGTGNVSGSGFNATVANIGSGLLGSAQGQFYGPNAEEVGGTFQATGSGGVFYRGAFGGN